MEEQLPPGRRIVSIEESLQALYDHLYPKIEYVVLRDDKIVERIQARSAKDACDQQTEEGDLYIKCGPRINPPKEG